MHPGFQHQTLTTYPPPPPFSPFTKVSPLFTTVSEPIPSTPTCSVTTGKRRKNRIFKETYTTRDWEREGAGNRA